MNFCSAVGCAGSVNAQTAVVRLQLVRRERYSVFRNRSNDNITPSRLLDVLEEWSVCVDGELASAPRGRVGGIGVSRKV